MISRLIHSKHYLTLFRQNSSIAIPLLYSLELRCRSCGIKVQDKNKDEPGYYIKPVKLLDDSKNFSEEAQKLGLVVAADAPNILQKPIKKRPLDEAYDKLISKMSQSDKDLLVNDFTLFGQPKYKDSKDLETIPKNDKGETVKEVVNKIYTVKPDETSVECMRCRNIQYQSSYKMTDENFPISEMEQVLQNLPRASTAPLVYLFNANDFPMGINPNIFKFRNPKDIYFIMTKTDNLVADIKNKFNKSAILHEYTKTFVSDYLGIKYGVPKQNIFLSSSLKGWKLDELHRFIPDGSYIIGNTNCGKSTMIKSLMLNEELQNKKEQVRHVPFNTVSKIKDKFKQQFYQKVGPGVSYLPGFTRDIIPLNIGLKTVYDVPGFSSSPKIHYLYESIKEPKIIHRLIKGEKTFAKGYNGAQYKSFKGPQVLCFEGLGYLQLPKDCLFQIRNVTNFKIHAFSNIDKAAKLAQNIPPSLANDFAIGNHSLFSQFDKYLVPPFYGSIELVFENFGYIHIKPIGAKQSNELMKLYLYPGLQSIIRQPIINYITKTPTGFDKYGNALMKYDPVYKSEFALKRFRGGEEYQPLFSRLIPCVKDIEKSVVVGGAAAAGAAETNIVDGNDAQGLAQSLKNQGYLQLNQFLKRRAKYDESYYMDASNKYDFWVE